MTNDGPTLGQILHEAREAGNDGRDRPMFLAPWAERDPRLKMLDEAMAEAVAAEVRERIRAHVHDQGSGKACCDAERREYAAALEARRDERERIRQIAIEHDAFYDAPCPDGVAGCVHQDMPFANLLGSEEGDSRG